MSLKESSRTDKAVNSGTTAPVTEQVKQQAHQVVEQTQQKAGKVLDQVGSQVKSRLASQKDLAAEGLGNVALAVRQTGQHLREQEQQALGQYTDQAAEAVENFSGYLRRTELDEFTGQVESFARSQPALFLGSVFALGFLAARFLKSSSRDGGATGTDGAAPRQLPAPIDEQASEVRTTDDAASTAI
jgi:nucleoid DNA-binding protein